MRIAILTNFERYHSGHSLTSIVQDQVVVLTKYGHQVDLFVGKKWEGEGDNYEHVKMYPLTQRSGHPVIPIIPPVDDPIDYDHVSELSAPHSADVTHIAHHIRSALEMPPSPYDLIITHDWVFGGRHLPYAEAIRLIANEPRARSVPWLHWVHSVPTCHKDWWDPERYGANHHVIYSNETDRLVVASLFRCNESRIIHIPPIRDLRILWDWGVDSVDFVHDYPGVMQADIVQVYPASTDRLTPKGLEILIRLFADFKRRGRSVCLVIANQWATRIRESEDLEKWERVAENFGLTPDEFVFTSQWRYPQYEGGISRRFLNELSQCVNLFIYPTQAESFGLILPEISLSSGCMCVLNSSLDMMREVGSNRSLYLDMGSYRRHWAPKNQEAWTREAASRILARFDREDGVQEKTHHRQSWNIDRVYRDYYEPIIADVKARVGDAP